MEDMSARKNASLSNPSFLQSAPSMTEFAALELPASKARSKAFTAQPFKTLSMPCGYSAAPVTTGIGMISCVEYSTTPPSFR